MDEKKVREEYLEFPWGIADTIENLKELKRILQRQVEKADCDGRGVQDDLEVCFDFDRAIEALEKQLPKKVEYEGGFSNNGLARYRMAKCPTCDRWYSSRDEIIYCSKCGQKLDWSKEDEQRNPF